MQNFIIYHYVPTDDADGDEYIIISENEINIEDNCRIGYAFKRMHDCQTMRSVKALPLQRELTLRKDE